MAFTKEELDILDKASLEAFEELDENDQAVLYQEVYLELKETYKKQRKILWGLMYFFMFVIIIGGIYSVLHVVSAGDGFNDNGLFLWTGILISFMGVTMLCFMFYRLKQLDETYGELISIENAPPWLRKNSSEEDNEE